MQDLERRIKKEEIYEKELMVSQPQQIIELQP